MWLTVVVVTYNTPIELVEECVRSVEAAAAHLRWSLPPEADSDVDVIIVDNGNPSTVTSELPLVRLTPGRNLGFGAANNLALKSTSADFVLLLNPDASLREGALTAFWRAATGAQKDALMVGSLLHNGAVQGDAYRLWYFSLQQLVQRRRSMFVVRKACGAALFARRSLLTRFGPFDERFFLYGEDADLSLRARKERVDVIRVAEAMVDHRAAHTQSAAGEIVECARADAAVRLAAYHLPYVASLLQRVELAMVTVIGTALPTHKTSSSSRGSRLLRLRVLRAWHAQRDCPVFSPTVKS